MNILGLPLPVLICAWIVSRRKCRKFTAISNKEMEHVLQQRIAFLETITNNIPDGYLNRLLRSVLNKELHTMHAELLNLSMLQSFGSLVFGYVPMTGEGSHEDQHKGST